MSPAAITKSISRLRTAKTALARIAATKDFESFKADWDVFLSAWKGIYTALEQGAKVSPQSQQWFGKQKAVRKKDPLLDYLFVARNDMEHSLADGLVLHSGGGNTLIHFPDAGTDHPGGWSLTWKRDPNTGQETFERSDGGPLEIVHSSPSGPTLCAVERRDRSVVFTPHFHLGELLPDPTPLTIAAAGIRYVERMIEEAAKLQGPSREKHS